MKQADKKISRLFRLLAQPTRLGILQAIGENSVCVCHLETALGFKQAYISQQLMVLRKSGLVKTQREGRHIYYRLSDASFLSVIKAAADSLGCEVQPVSINPVKGCPCPKCNPGKQV
jgi:ArsR family transcriptional regulator